MLLLGPTFSRHKFHQLQISLSLFPKDVKHLHWRDFHKDQLNKHCWRLSESSCSNSNAQLRYREKWHLLQNSTQSRVTRVVHHLLIQIKLSFYKSPPTPPPTPSTQKRRTDSEGRETGREPICQLRKLNLIFSHHYHTTTYSIKNTKSIAFNLITWALRGKRTSSGARWVWIPVFHLLCDDLEQTT